MIRATVPYVAEHPGVDYAHLPGEESNPLMESTLHVDWGIVLLNSVRHTLAGTDHLVTGNVALAPTDGGRYTAPDLMVIPGAAGQEFGLYEPGPDAPLPSVCLEIVSPSNTRPQIRARCERLLRIGVPEVYVLDPRHETVVQVSVEPDGALREVSAIGTRSEGLLLSFGLVDGHLAVCCPAGRVVRPGDDPFGWLRDEMNRADAAEADLDRARAEADAWRSEVDVWRSEADLLRAEADALRARVAALESGGSNAPPGVSSSD